MPWLKTLATLKRCLDAPLAFLTPLSSRSSNKSDSISCKEPPRSWRSNAAMRQCCVGWYDVIRMEVWWLWCARPKLDQKMCRTCLEDAFSLKANLSVKQWNHLASWNLWNNPSFPCRLPRHGNHTPSTEIAECLFSTSVENLWHSKSPMWKMPPIASNFSQFLQQWNARGGVIHCLLNGIHQRAIDAMIACHAKPTLVLFKRTTFDDKQWDTDKEVTAVTMPFAPPCPTMPHLLGRDSS